MVTQTCVTYYTAACLADPTRILQRSYKLRLGRSRLDPSWQSASFLTPQTKAGLVTAVVRCLWAGTELFPQAVMGEDVADLFRLCHSVLQLA